jgi:hypothetical protein
MNPSPAPAYAASKPNPFAVPQSYYAGDAHAPVGVGVQSTSAMAIVSLIAGIGAWSFLPGLGAIVAVLTGHLAKREIRESGGRTDGEALATFGLWLGYAQVALVAVILLVLIVIVIAAIPMNR